MQRAFDHALSICGQLYLFIPICLDKRKKQSFLALVGEDGLKTHSPPLWLRLCEEQVRNGASKGVSTPQFLGAWCELDAAEQEIRLHQPVHSHSRGVRVDTPASARLEEVLLCTSCLSSKRLWLLLSKLIIFNFESIKLVFRLNKLPGK